MKRFFGKQNSYFVQINGGCYNRLTRNFLLFAGFSLYLILCPILVSDATAKKSPASGRRVAVLYFKDSTQFDSPTGCGCIPGFIGKIFSTKKLWDLEAGFAKILNRRLVETGVYTPVSKDELLDAMAQMTLSRHDLHKLDKLDKTQRAQFAKLLNADTLVTGDIRKFNQERIKANASRTLREGGRDNRSSASFIAPIQVLGYLHRVTVKLDMTFYNAAGDIITELPIAASRDHALAGTRVASLQASVTEDGTNLSFGQTTENQRRNPNPIVKPAQLNKIKFASSEYEQTLYGMVTTEALIKVVLALRDNVGPRFITPWETRRTTDEKKTNAVKISPDEPIKGKIQYVDSENLDQIYVNIGSAKGIAINQQFAVYGQGAPIRDIDTGEILTYKLRKIAIIAVSEIRNDKVSIFRLVEGTDAVKKGDIVQEIRTDDAERTEEK